MAITIINSKAINCGTGLRAPSSADMLVDNFETIGCGIGTDIYIDNSDLSDLLIKLEKLKLSTENEEKLRSKVTTLINTQMIFPTAIKELSASFRNIFEGATGSLVYATYSVWAIAHGLPVTM